MSRNRQSLEMQGPKEHERTCRRRDQISEAQSSNGLHLGTLREAPDIAEYFLKVYRPEKFTQVFCFTKAFLDVVGLMVSQEHLRQPGYAG